MKNKFLVVSVVLLTIFLGLVLVFIGYNKSRIYSLSDAPTEEVAIVFGAQVKDNGVLSDALKLRVDTSIDLYKNNKIKKLLFTGDNSRKEYDEVTNMQKYAIDNGVPESAITLDYAGFRTYDSCYRAKEIFGVDKAILVTQEYHLYRTIFTCNAIGIESVGVVAPDYMGPALAKGKIREIPAVIQSVFDVIINRQPKFLGKFEGLK